MKRRWLGVSAMLLALWLMPLGSALAEVESTGLPESRGQLVYVSAYSHVYMLDKRRKLYLSVTLSLRNTDLEDALTIQSVGYFDSNGHLVREFLDEPVTVPPLGTVETVVDRSDRSGGAGANFLVDWSSERPISPPIIESLMVSAGAGSSALAFARSGQVLKEH